MSDFINQLVTEHQAKQAKANVGMEQEVELTQKEEENTNIRT